MVKYLHDSYIKYELSLYDFICVPARNELKGIEHDLVFHYQFHVIFSRPSEFQMAQTCITFDVPHDVSIKIAQLMFGVIITCH